MSTYFSVDPDCDAILAALERKRVREAPPAAFDPRDFIRRRHDYPIYDDPDVPPWDDRLGRFRYEVAK